ncbi:hypothetical protein Q3V30_19005 [Erwinia pyri]|uniref:Uncharacterized protein n=1 Tax=Erwinia pyri TaxID=3062598 RepID=A0AA50HPY9_9GAMM|nr:hypothetical protein [Erwinia sp. DE2]WLS78515.1 hypothetical protein Q3V30_19005 [Erwinia sp. DE2]
MLVARKMTVYKYSIIICRDRSSPAAAFFCGRGGRACQATLWQEIYFKQRNYQRGAGERQKKQGKREFQERQKAKNQPAGWFF